MTGNLTNSVSIDTPTILNGSFVGTVPSSSGNSGTFLTTGSTSATITGNNFYSGVNTYSNLLKCTATGNQSKTSATLYVAPLSTNNPAAASLYFSTYEIPSVSGAGVTTESSTLKILGAPLAIGGGSITNSYALNCATGLANIPDGVITSKLNNGADITIPNSSGTLALTSQIPTNSTYVDLTSTQSNITGLKTFSNNSGLIVADVTTPASTLTLKASAAGSFNSSVIGQASANAIDFYLPATVTLNGGLSDFLTTTTNTCSFLNKSFLTNAPTTSSCAFVSYADSSIVTKFDQSGATTGAVLSLVCNQSTARSVTLPDATDTLVGRSTTDTLQNKILDNSNTWFGDHSDTTKTLKVSTSGNTTGIAATLSFACSLARTYTFPNVASDTVSLLAATQTLTNKSLSDTTTAVINATDATKKYAWDLSGQTTGTTTTLKTAQTVSRNYTIPNSAADASFVLTQASATQVISTAVQHTGTLQVGSGTAYHQILSGALTLTTPNIAGSGGTLTTTALTFSTAFTTTVPTVTCSLDFTGSGGSNWGSCNLIVFSVTLTQLQFFITNLGSGATTGNVNVNWTAVN